MGFDHHNRYFNEIELSKIASGTLDRSMKRLFTQFFKIGSFDQPKEDFRNITANVTTQEHKNLAQKLSEEGTVLLKNDDQALPLENKKG